MSLSTDNKLRGLLKKKGLEIHDIVYINAVGISAKKLIKKIENNEEHIIRIYSTFHGELEDSTYEFIKGKYKEYYCNEHEKPIDIFHDI